MEKVYFYLGLVALKASVGAPCTNTKWGLPAALLCSLFGASLACVFGSVCAVLLKLLSNGVLSSAPCSIGAGSEAFCLLSCGTL